MCWQVVSSHIHHWLVQSLWQYGIHCHPTGATTQRIEAWPPNAPLQSGHKTTQTCQQQRQFCTLLGWRAVQKSGYIQLHVNKSKRMQGLMFLQQRCWGFKSVWMWQCSHLSCSWRFMNHSIFILKGSRWRPHDLQNVWNHKALQPRTPESSAKPMWEPQIKQCTPMWRTKDGSYLVMKHMIIVK